jgi:hypothetical protein
MLEVDLVHLGGVPAPLASDGTAAAAEASAEAEAEAEALGCPRRPGQSQRRRGSPRGRDASQAREETGKVMTAMAAPLELCPAELMRAPPPPSTASAAATRTPPRRWRRERAGESKRLVVEWPWSQLTSECQRFCHPPRLVK